MSVINQMLKDLDKREPEPNKVKAQFNNAGSNYSARKIVLVTSLIVLALCLLSFYVWQLISENKALKAQQITRSAQLSVNNIHTGTGGANAADLQLAPKKQVIKKVFKAKVTEPVNLAKTVANNLPLNDFPLRTLPSSTETTSKTPIITPKVVVNNSSTRVTPASKQHTITDTDSHVGSRSNHSHDAAPVIKTKTSKMSVSRRQLSVDELTQQKLALAEKALAVGQIEKAENLLEDAVILKPSDSQTRKKLAALWFGRKAYQDATNLLSQGIALNGKDSSLREMKARIHLQQGQVTAALNTLKPLAQLKDEQYQIMLANTAQQAQQNKVAINAYQTLTAMQPEIGRWQLGLAVLYDKNSQFILASVAYKKALTKNDLSVSSQHFIKQRIQVIGQ